jgi:hypothetical protein
MINKEIESKEYLFQNIMAKIESTIIQCMWNYRHGNEAILNWNS